jgi:hypothetical protein
MANILISDFNLGELASNGSAVGEQTLIDEFNLDFIRSTDVKGFNKDDFYVISNISLMKPHLVSQIKDYNYIIFECDYKIVASRHPWRYPNDLVPKKDRINYDLYENAKAVFVKSTDHMNVFKKNEVKGKFINMRTNIWSESDLNLMEEIYNKTKEKNGLHCVYNSKNWIKNTEGSIKYCQDNNIKYGQIGDSPTREQFLRSMANYSTFLFFPIARETYCRIVIEAKCLGLDVTTTYVGPSSTNRNKNNYGVTQEDYYPLKGKEMIDYLRIGNKINIAQMKKYIQKND